MISKRFIKLEMAQIGINIEASASQDVDLDTPQLLVDQSAEAKKA